MKLRKLHIEDYKMFKDFDISFVDEHDEPLPIVILAGVNGSGKTTLLEYLKDFSTIEDSNKKTFIETDKFTIDRGQYGINTRRDDNEIYFNENISYLDVNHQLEGLKEAIYLHLHKLVWEEDILASKAFEQLREFINGILEELNPNIEFDSQNKGEELFFRTKGLKNKFSIDELSTGEKTLLSKLLFLYFLDYKNKVILIDEPELSLHPSWQNKVLKIYENFAKQNNCQIIIATHSPHIIGSAKSEYIRLLVKEDNQIKVVDNFHNTYGLKFSQILTDVMGVEYLRPIEVEKQLSKVKSMIVQNEYDSDMFKKEWSELEKLLGEDYLELKLLKVEIASRRKNVSSK